MPIRDNIPKRGSSGITIIGLPRKTEALYISEVSPTITGKKRTGTLSNSTTNSSCRLTTTSTQSGVTSDGTMYVDTTEFYDLTGYKNLCINAIEKDTSHTGHRWWVELILESGARTKVLDGTRNGNTNTTIDISGYTGKYRIGIHIYTGYASYGYSSEYVDVNVMFLGLSR